MAAFLVIEISTPKQGQRISQLCILDALGSGRAAVVVAAHGVAAVDACRRGDAGSRSHGLWRQGWARANVCGGRAQRRCRQRCALSHAAILVDKVGLVRRRHLKLLEKVFDAVLKAALARHLCPQGDEKVLGRGKDGGDR